MSIGLQEFTATDWNPCSQILRARALVMDASRFENQLTEESDERLCEIVMDDWDGRRAGDRGRKAFDVLYRRHFRFVQRLVALVLGLSARARQDADFVANGVMMKLLQAIRKGAYHPSRPLAPYIKSMARNAARTYGSRGRKSSGGGVLELLADDEPTPLEQLLNDEVPQRVRDVLQNMPDDYRVIIELRYLEGLSHDEMKTRLGLTNGALRGLIHRAKQRFREEYERRLA